MSSGGNVQTQCRCSGNKTHASIVNGRYALTSIMASRNSVLATGSANIFLRRYVTTVKKYVPPGPRALRYMDIWSKSFLINGSYRLVVGGAHPTRLPGSSRKQTGWTPPTEKQPDTKKIPHSQGGESGGSYPLFNVKNWFAYALTLRMHLRTGSSAVLQPGHNPADQSSPQFWPPWLPCHLWTAL